MLAIQYQDINLPEQVFQPQLNTAKILKKMHSKQFMQLELHIPIVPPKVISHMFDWEPVSQFS